jgi:hypothetical protein
MTRLPRLLRDRLGGMGMGMGLRVVKTGLACALAWLLAERLVADGLPVLAPLAALLTVQVTIYRSVTVGLQRAAAVMAGVLVDESRAAITQAEESVRYNPRRAVQSAPTAHLRAALTALEHAAFQVRGIARALADLSASDPEAAARLSPRFGELLAAVAAAMHADAEALRGEPGSLERLRDALAAAHDRLAEAEVALRAGAGAESPLWHIHGSLLADASRLLREVDPDTGPHAEALRTPR